MFGRKLCPAALLLSAAWAAFVSGLFMFLLQSDDACGMTSAGYSVSVLLIHACYAALECLPCCNVPSEQGMHALERLYVRLCRSMLLQTVE